MATKSSKTTIDHDEIREWVESRKGCPARVKATGRGKKDTGILRIDYTGFSGQDTLETISWEDWLSAFDADRLAFVYSTNPESRFSKLVARSTAKRATASKKKAPTAKKKTSTSKKTTGAKKKTATAKTTGAKKKTATAKKKAAPRKRSSAAQRG